MQNPIADLRQRKGVIWNLRAMLEKFPTGGPEKPWNRPSVVFSNENWLDEFVWHGYRQYGTAFLAALEGRFAVAYFDAESKRIFLARDFMGEMTMHCLQTQGQLLVANTITAIQDAARDDYYYKHLWAFPQAHFKDIEVTWPKPPETLPPLNFQTGKVGLYYDWEEETLARVQEFSETPKIPDLTRIGDLLKESVRQRARLYGSQPVALLLSGGLDSLSVALAMRTLGIRFEAYTLRVEDQPGESMAAQEYARKLGVPHHIVSINRHEIKACYEEAIRVSECYHLYNVYCAVGMLLFGKKLTKEFGVKAAFCGEAVNETVGDYKDWYVLDSIEEKYVRIQAIDHEANQQVRNRLRLVWGQKSASQKYNRQLGTGLAKHAGSRMVKPFLSNGIDLECPYYERKLLTELTALPPDLLRSMDFKPGLMWKIFEKDFLKFRFSEDVVKTSKKVRLQDATEPGEIGISSVLMSNGRDGVYTMREFNDLFDAGLNPRMESRRLYSNH